MPRFYPVETELDGRPARGEWTLLQGGRICVHAVGCPAHVVALDGARPEAMAREVLRRMLEDRCAQPWPRRASKADPREPTFLVSVLVEGRSWSGRWSLDAAAREVLVTSAYGARPAPLKRSTPERVAERLLKELVEEWRADQANP